ncbi:MAG: hypothetical protein ACXVB4_12485, partial [Pseudobdellovibrionaceae bacterium]
YILSAKQNLSEQVISSAFHSHSLFEIKRLGNNQYLLRFNPDPGVEKVRECISSFKLPGTIQPNIIYKLEPPAGLPLQQDNELRK